MMKYPPTEPIGEKIVPKRQGVARHYGSHPYFTRRPWNVVHTYIKHFCPPGGTVLDPFGGSGVTAVEALVLKRKAVHVDINPLANFITEQIAVSPVRLEQLGAAFDRVRHQCEALVAEWRKKPDSFFEGAKPPFWYPAHVRLPKNADAEFVDQLFTGRQLFNLSLILDAIYKEKDQRLRDLLRFCFSATLAKTNRTFISARNRAESRGGATVFSVYRYNIPRRPVELDPWDQFAARFRNLMLCKRETNKLIGSFYSAANCRILGGSATDLGSFCRPGSVDYVFTDPPYGAHIAYLDLSTMWNAWLRFSVTDSAKASEIIEGGDLRHSREHYTAQLSRALEQIGRMLKEEAWLSLVFEHRDTSLYSAIMDKTEQAGLHYVNTVGQVLEVVWSMHKKKNQMNVLSGELILNFRKTAHARRPQPAAQPVDVKRLITEVASQEIRSHRGASTEGIFNRLMVRLIDSKEISHQAFTLDEVLNQLANAGFEFDPESGRWYLHRKPSRDQLRLSF
jgi:DNA modification methylase